MKDTFAATKGRGDPPTSCTERIHGAVDAPMADGDKAPDMRPLHNGYYGGTATEPTRQDNRVLDGASVRLDTFMILP